MIGIAVGVVSASSIKDVPIPNPKPGDETDATISSRKPDYSPPAPSQYGRIVIAKYGETVWT